MLDIDAPVVRYINAGADGKDVQRIFKYSLSRQDLEIDFFLLVQFDLVEKSQ
ncbi:DUF3143 domain-containing protein [Phormidium sp. FACHB-1136]|nr:DUF3143 domain-containing protein [Phormidium sp. FACHB-1136]